MFYPMIPSLVKAYQESLVRDAERDRLVKVLVPANPRLKRRVFLRVGDLMISLGTRLRERYEPAVPYEGEAYSSAAGKVRA